jgi:hypothetical protein
MSLTKRKRSKELAQEPDYLSPHILVDYELPFARDMIKPGDIIRIKGDRGRYRFKRVATNTALGVTWVDCHDIMTGTFRSFYIENIKLVERPKKSRRKKQSVPRNSSSI